MADDEHATRLDHLWRVHADAQQTIRALDAKAFGLLALSTAMLALVSNASDDLASHRFAAASGIAGALLLLAGGVLAMAVVYPRPARRAREEPAADADALDLFGPDIRRRHADAAGYRAAQSDLSASDLAGRVATGVHRLAWIVEAKAVWVRAAAVCTGLGLVLAGVGVAAGAVASG